MSQRTVTRKPPSGQNYNDKIGLVVYQTGANEVTLCTDPTTQRPFGVIVAAENATDGDVTVQHAGDCFKNLFGAVVTPGTHEWVTCDANSKVIACTAGRYALGRFRRDEAAAATSRDGGITIEPQINQMA